MIKLDKDYIRCLVKTVPQRKNASAWKRGVKFYAIWLIDKLPDDYCIIFETQGELEKHIKNLKKLLLNGAENWYRYSCSGRVYVRYNDIAWVLCTPSEYRKTKGGEKRLNRCESWLVVQAQALLQAEILITSTIRDFAYECFTKYNK